MSGEEKTPLQKTIEAIHGCAFTLDKEENATSSRNLLKIQIRLREKKFDTEAEVTKLKSEILLSEPFQKGKMTKDVKEAKMELELAGTSYDKLREYNMLLSIIHAVEAHNEKIL